MTHDVKTRLCLGTVQFGLEYGVNNKTGKPSPDEVFTMLDYALEQGIEYIDTAAAYGNAEELLGEYFSSRNIPQDLKVISKLTPNLIADDCSDGENLVIREIEKSLQRLRLDSLEGYLLHTPTNFYNPSIMRGLKQAKDLGLIKNLGVSIYETQHALDVVSSGLVDYIQVPYNIFDQRLEKNDFFSLARANGVMVFGRAPFLQGLLFMQPSEVPEHLARARDYLQEFAEIIARYDLGRAEATLLFSAQNPGIDRVVFGIDNMAQLKEDIAVISAMSTDTRCREELKLHFITMEKEIIFPSLWAKR
ncbi:MAG: aldo/keto reductase [Syntrophomonadaceae bacterium]|nr:aldo/keto reductase [Syntrophomonadaceae bacterium]